MAYVDPELDPNGNGGDGGQQPPPTTPAPTPAPTQTSGGNQADRIDPSRQQDFLNQAKSLGVSDSYISDFLSRNPGDYNRLASSYESGQTGSGPDTNAKSSGSGFNYKDPKTGAWVSMPLASARGTGGPLSIPTMNAAGGGPYTNGTYTGAQFSDPYTSQLEALIRQQMGQLQSPAAGSPQQMLTDFLTKQFQTLSNSQGYTPDQTAVLRTQALEPINNQRQALDQQTLERASKYGMLPTSGLVQDQLAHNATQAATNTTAAQRDLAINSINHQTQQLQQALGLGNDLNQLDVNTRNQLMQLSQMLYQLPINAENQAMNVINGTGSPVNLLQQLFGMQQSQQQYSNQSLEALFSQLGQLIPGLFGGGSGFQYSPNSQDPTGATF